MEEGVFSRGYSPPPLPVPPPLLPTLKLGETRRYPSPSGHPNHRSFAPGASGCGSCAPLIDGLGHGLPLSPPSPRGCTARCLLGSAGCPLCPVPLLSGGGTEQSESLLSPRCSAGITSSLLLNACDGEDFQTLLTSSTTLNFSVTQTVKQFFFPFIIQIPG